MPDSFELPWAWSAVIRLMRSERFAGFIRSVVNKFIALTLWLGCGIRFADGRSRLKPRLTAVVGALNYLSKPAAGLRRVNAVGINAGTFHVIDLPAGKVRATDVPFFTLSI